VGCVVAMNAIAHLSLLRLVGVPAAKVNVSLPLLVSCFLEVFVLFQPEQEMKKVIFVDPLVPRCRVCAYGLSPGPAYRHHFNRVVEVQSAQLVETGLWVDRKPVRAWTALQSSAAFHSSGKPRLPPLPVGFRFSAELFPVTFSQVVSHTLFLCEPRLFCCHKRGEPLLGSGSISVVFLSEVGSDLAARVRLGIPFFLHPVCAVFPFPCLIFLDKYSAFPLVLLFRTFRMCLCRCLSYLVC